MKYLPRISADLLPIILVGLPGAGKTTVARKLSVALGVQVTDTDAEVRRRARATIPEIFAAEGENGFRARETRALRHILLSSAGAQGVVALGGGAVIRAENRDMLAGHTVIYLDASPDTAAAHVGNGAGRPLIASAQTSSDEEDLLINPVLERMKELYAERHNQYEQVAVYTVKTENLTPEQITANILTLLRRAEPNTYADKNTAASVFSPLINPADQNDFLCVRINGENPYNVVIGSELKTKMVAAIKRIPGAGRGGVAVIHADCVQSLAEQYLQALKAAGFSTMEIAVPGGESAKKVATLNCIWEQLAAHNLGRDGVIVAIGGGATTDLGGFAAATWLRSVPVLQVPTTLLAMVDAAVGGKCGIDIVGGKNLVGAFHSPVEVLCDLNSLNSLPENEFRGGFGEVIKCGFIADRVILEQIIKSHTDLKNMTTSALSELIARCVAVKAAVVGQDFTESGLREILNYGHTYAHAIETFTNYSWSHGYAVAVGCVFAGEVAVNMGILDPALLDLHREVFKCAGLPTTFPQGKDHLDEMLSIMRRDKKVRAGRIRMVLLKDLETPIRGVEPEAAALASAHKAVSKSAV